MTNNTFQMVRLHTPCYLLQSYADLSLAQKKFLTSLQKGSLGPYDGLLHNFALLTLNAAIMEGILRLAISDHLFKIEQNAVDQGIKSGKDAKDLLERCLDRVRIEVDSADTWASLKEKFSFVFKAKLSDVITLPTMTKIDHLFTIRNKAAHGSALQLPVNPVTEEEEYLFALSKKVSGLTSFVKAEYKVNDLYEGLASPKIVLDLWKSTTDAVAALEAFCKISKSQIVVTEMVKNYQFGTLFDYKDKILSMTAKK